MKSRLLLTLLLSTLNIVSFSQTVADVWVSMPESMTPYLTLNDKKEMIECDRIGVDTKVKNKFEGYSSIDTLSADYGKFILSTAKDVQIALLPTTEGDSIICKISTLRAPQAKSELKFYDFKWNELDSEKMIEEFNLNDFSHRPDTMDQKQYEELLLMIEPFMTEYSFNPTEKILEVFVSLPLVSKDDKSRINAIISKKRLIWNGKTFN